MNRKEKIEYLNRLKTSQEYFYKLKDELERVKGVRYDDNVKSTVHRTLTDKIHEKDLAYIEMIETYIEIDKICGDNIFLGYHFVLMKSYDEIANILNCSTSTVRKMINMSLDRLEI